MNINDIPEVEFIEVDIENMLANMIAEYEDAYYQQTGKIKKLQSGDPIRIFIYSQALRLYQAYELINYVGKQNLLKYATSTALDNIAARYGIVRKEAQKAICTIKFYLSAPQSEDIYIPQYTKISNGQNVFFQTTSQLEIKAGEIEAETRAEAVEAGENSNSFLPGQLNVLVDPVAYVQKVENIDLTQGGAEIEDDESFRNRIFLAPESFSVAGPSGAYEYFSKQFSEEIGDLKIKSNNPGEVDIYVLLKNGEFATETFLEELKDYLSDANRRPLTDKVVVSGPVQETYNIELTYFIDSANSNLENSIKQKVENAIEDYILWQKSSIGRDINPSELVRKIINAGAKRVEITAPIFKDIDDINVAVVENKNILYGGIENV